MIIQAMGSQCTYGSVVRMGIWGVSPQSLRIKSSRIPANLWAKGIRCPSLAIAILHKNLDFAETMVKSLYGSL
jgi:hypothetical protein